MHVPTPPPQKQVVPVFIGFAASVVEPGEYRLQNEGGLPMLTTMAVICACEIG
jgi:hypothetical protein